jgi:[ribosomal protein S18]-alanine N-acetyltransferase
VRTLPATWAYEAPYDIYNIAADDLTAEVEFLTDADNHYFGIWQGGVLVGFCCFGAEARVPGGTYADEALDIGMGMRPDLTGQGQSTTYVQAVLDFVQHTFTPTAVRATVAAFNERAQRACKKAGMQVIETFVHPKNGKRFVVLQRPPQ